MSLPDNLQSIRYDPLLQLAKKLKGMRMEVRQRAQRCAYPADSQWAAHFDGVEKGLTMALTLVCLDPWSEE